jgi:hypothetical protein
MTENNQTETEVMMQAIISSAAFQATIDKLVEERLTIEREVIPRRATEGTREQPIVVTQTKAPDFEKLPLLDLDNPSTVYPWVYAFENALRKSDVSPEEWKQHLLRAPQSTPTSLPTMELYAAKHEDAAKDYATLRNSLCQHYGPPTPEMSLLLSLQLRFPSMKTTEEWVLACRLTRALVDVAANAAGTPPCSEENITAVLISPFPENKRIKLEKRVSELCRIESKRCNLFDVVCRHLPEIVPPPTQLAAVAFVGESNEKRFSRKRPQQPPSRTNDRHPKRTNKTSPCRWCGRSECTDRATCPAKEQTCSKCHKLGHFARVCRSSDTKGAASSEANAN